MWKLEILLALVALAGSGAIMIWPTHTWIGWALISMAIVGGALLLYYHLCEKFNLKWQLGQKCRMTALLGMILCAAGFLLCAGFYFYSPDIPAAPTLNAAPVLESPKAEMYPLAFNWESASLNGHDGETGWGSLDAFRLSAKNAALKETVINDAYIISGITGQKIRMYVASPPAGGMYPEDAEPIPPNAVIEFSASFWKLDTTGIGIPQDVFLRDWNTFTLVVICDGREIRHSFDRSYVESQIYRDDPTHRPHVTRKGPEASPRM